MKPQAGFGCVPRKRSPRDQSYSKSVPREKIVPGPREDGDLTLEGVEVEETEASPGETREALRILARWLARAALEMEKSRKSPKPREKQVRNPAILP